VSRISGVSGRKRLAGQRVEGFGSGVVAEALCNFGKKGLGRLTIAPALGRGARRSGVRFFVGIEVAAEGRVFDFEFVVALFEFLDRGDHRRDEGRVFQREGFGYGGFQAARCYWIHS
jgi:hypothetical protein